MDQVQDALAHCRACARRLRLARPGLIATALVCSMLAVSELRHVSMLQRVALVDDGLTLVVVLLAVPLARQLRALLRASRAVLGAVFVGSFVALLSSLAIPLVVGAASDVLATVAPTSTTSEIALALAKQFDRVIGLTALGVIAVWGVVAAFGPAFLVSAGVRDDRAKGFVLGVAAHAIGAARAFQISEAAGVFASLGMALNALTTVLVVPIALAATL